MTVGKGIAIAGCALALAGIAWSPFGFALIFALPLFIVCAFS